MGALTPHMHLHIKAPEGRRFYVGTEWSCPFCNWEHQARSYEVATVLESYINDRVGEVIGEYEMRSHLREDSISDAEISHGLAYLSVTVCNSCRAVITCRNGHREPCVHSSDGWPK